MALCDTSDFVTKRAGLVRTQYRESTNLRWMINRLLTDVQEGADGLCSILNAFDLDTATGHQLTLIGRWMGWPRDHCTGRKLPVFGFACTGGECSGRGYIVEGFCETGDFVHWGCGVAPSRGEYAFTDDELYRAFLKALVYKHRSDFTRQALHDAAAELFGSAVTIRDVEPGVVAVHTGRLLTDDEMEITHLYEQVLPVAPGVEFRLYESDSAPFGFGDGWGGFCGVFPTPLYNT